MHRDAIVMGTDTGFRSGSRYQVAWKATGMTNFVTFGQATRGFEVERRGPSGWFPRCLSVRENERNLPTTRCF